jgi:hypothetical protein
VAVNANIRLAFSSSQATNMLAWAAMGSMGKVRQHLDQRWYVDFGHGRRIWTLRVGDEAKLALTEDLAHRVLELVRGQLSEGKPLDEALAQFQPSHYFEVGREYYVEFTACP